MLNQHEYAPGETEHVDDPQHTNIKAKEPNECIAHLEIPMPNQKTPICSSSKNPLHKFTLELNTKLAKSLVGIIDNPLLKHFNNLRYKMKSDKGKVSIREYTSCSEYLKKKVLGAHEKIQKELSEWERDFAIANDRLPARGDYTPEMKVRIHQKNITLKVLMHEWQT